MFDLFLAAAAPSAGGAAIGQVAGLTLAVSALTAALLWLGLRHRAGHATVLDRASAALARFSGLPGWAALPLALSGASLIVAVVGLYWDVALHIDQGRDPGPLANPSHYFILAGLYGIFSAGWLAIVLPRERPGPAALRVGRDWEAPVGGVLMLACASFALLGFPLDDVSHRLFGQDVTLWGPTHLMMLGGAALTLVAVLVLFTEARLALGGAPAAGRGGAALRRARLVAACGGMLVGLSIFQGEFDYGVAQFRLLFHPVLIAFAATLALVLARTLVGRGGALAAVAFFLALRGLLALLVGPLLGETTPHFPLYVAEGLLVELVALRARPGSLRFAALAGAAIATLGVLAEYGWSHAWMPLPWPAHLLGEAIALALPAALAGGVLATFAAGGLRLDAARVARPRAWALAGASVLTLGAVVAALLPTSVPAGARAEIALRPVAGHGAARTVAARIRVAPADAVRDADWLTVTAWQGHERLVLDRLHALGGGLYATTRPIPVGGDWKAMLRFARGRELAAVPLALPADPAIPVGAVPPRAHATRAFVRDQHVLQRERKRDVPAWLWGVAGLVVLGCTLSLLLVLGWGLVRLAARGGAAPAREPVLAEAPGAERPLALGA